MWMKFKSYVNPQVVVSAALGGALLGVAAFVFKKVGIKPVTDVANIATKGAKK